MTRHVFKLIQLTAFVLAASWAVGARAQELVPLPKQIQEAPPRVAVVGFGSVALTSIDDADASATGKIAIAFWPNENITSFMAFNRGAGTTSEDSLSFRQVLFPEAGSIGFQGFVTYMWDVKDGEAKTDTITSNRAGPFADLIFQRMKVGEDGAEQEFDALFLSLGGMYQFVFINDRDTRFGATLGLSLRVQNILSAGRDDYDVAFAEVMPGVDPVHTFTGIGAKAGLQVNDFTFEFDLQWMGGARDADVPGVTGWSGIVTTTISGNLLRFPHGKNEETKNRKFIDEKTREAEEEKDEDTEEAEPEENP